MKNLLVTAQVNWADEFDTVFLKIFTEQEWNHHLEAVMEFFSENSCAEVYFGTNEAIEYDSFEDYLAKFSVEEISDKHAEFIKTHIYRKFRSDFGQSILIDC